MLGRNLKNTLIIDNLESNFRMNLENGIGIKSWFNDDQDKLLLKILNEFGDDLRKGVKHYRGTIAKEISEKSTEVKIKYKI
jgi:TFIIF-interacting CTD phosphatase-like protein